MFGSLPLVMMYCSVWSLSQQWVLRHGRACRFHWAWPFETLAGFVPQHMAVQLKWPNDILANQQKLVGMLLSSDVGANAIVAGIE